MRRLGRQNDRRSRSACAEYEQSIEEGAFEAWAGSTSNYYPQFLDAVCRALSAFRQNVPVSELTAEQMKKLLYGTGGEKVRFRYENDFGHSKEALVRLKGSSITWSADIGKRLRMVFVSISKRYMSASHAKLQRPPAQARKAWLLRSAMQNIAHVTALSIGEAEQFLRFT